MVVECLGNLEIILASVTLSKEVHLKEKEVYGKLSLDGTSWRNTQVRPPTDQGRGHVRTIPLETTPIVLPVSDQTHHVYVEIWTYRRAGNKEECVAKGKYSMKESHVIEKGRVEVQVELHHQLHLNRGHARVLLHFVKQPPGPPLVAIPHGALPDPSTSPTDKSLAEKFKETVRRLSKGDKDKDEGKRRGSKSRSRDRLDKSEGTLSKSI